MRTYDPDDESDDVKIDWIAAEFIEHAVEQGGAMLVNQPDFDFTAKHRLNDQATRRTLGSSTTTI